jgi:hypothetical protein
MTELGGGFAAADPSSVWRKSESTSQKDKNSRGMSLVM